MSILTPFHRLSKLMSGSKPVDLAPSGLSPFYHQADVLASGQLVFSSQSAEEGLTICFSTEDTRKLYSLLQDNITIRIKLTCGDRAELTNRGNLVLYWTTDEDERVRSLTTEETTTLFTLLHSNKGVIG